MATEKGKVIKLMSDYALVASTKSSSCESCSTKDACHVMGGGHDVEIETINTIGATVGDKVLIKQQLSELHVETWLYNRVKSRVAFDFFHHM